MRFILEDIRRGEQADIVTLVDPTGKVIVRATGASSGDVLLFDGFVPWALQNKIAAISTEELSSQELQSEGYAVEARVDSIPTPYSEDRNVRDAALARVVVLPIVSDGVIVAGIVVADILNRDTSLVEQLGKIHGVEASIFHDDVRVATTVMTEAGNPYVGTLLASEVVNVTIVKGDIYVGKIWAVYDWGRGAYYPLRNHRNETVGVLGIGIWDSQFRSNEGFMRGADIVHILILNSIIVAGLAIILAIIVTRAITRPIDALVDAAESVGRGDLEHEVHIDTYDEFDKLSAAFNVMQHALRKRSVEVEQDIVKKYKELLEER